MKKIVLFLLLCIFMFTLSSCNKAEETYKLGFVGTLSGDYSEVGVKEMYGVQLAVEEINNNGGINGIKIELFIRDDQADPLIAIDVQNELKDLGCDVIIGHSLSIVSDEVVSNANYHDILLLSPSIGTDKLSGIDDNFIRNVSTVFGETDSITKKILESNPSSVLLIYDDQNYGVTKYHESSFLSVLDSQGYTGERDTLGYSSGDADDVQLVYDLLTIGNYESVFFATSSTDASEFINFIKVNNLDISVHLSSWASAGILSYIDLSRTENIFIYTDYHSNYRDSKFIEYSTTYKEIYGIEADMLSSNGYDLVYLLKQVLEETDDWTLDNIKSKVVDINFNGINGNYYIDQFGDCYKPTVQYVIIDGQLELTSD